MRAKPILLSPCHQTRMFILKMLRVTLVGVVPMAIKPGRPATFFICSCKRVM